MERSRDGIITAPGERAGTASAPGSPISSVIIFVISAIERPVRSTGRPRNERKDDRVLRIAPVSTLEASKLVGFVKRSVINVLISASAVLNLASFFACS